MGFAIIVAADEDGGIGRDGGLPWRLKGDLAWFRRQTTRTTTEGARNAVIMGRRTWQSIPERFRPLPKRLNIVLSRSALQLPAGVLAARSLDEALTRAAEAGAESTFVIGGGAVYLEALARPDCARVLLTRVSGTHECDTFLPPGWRSGYRLEWTSEAKTDGGVGYDFTEWRREAESM